MPQPARIVHLEELESVPGPGTLTWRPVRSALGIRAFGCNAYTAQAAGEDVVEPHDEQGSDHEELYFVASGLARFTIDGEEHEAPAGTYVFVPDPASRRHAVALEPGTTVLTFGGPPTFEPSAWEWSFKAAPLIASDPAKAREIMQEGLQAHPESASLRYNLACLEAISGRPAQAIASLRAAVQRQPEVAQWAREDSDLASLRELPQFRELIGG